MSSPESKSTPPEPEPDLSVLLEDLRAEGYLIGVDEAVAIHRVALDHPDRDWSSLASLIGPVVCATEREQERFPTLFQAWLDRSVRPRTPHLTPLPGPASINLDQELGRRKRRRRRITVLISAVVLLGLGAFLWVLNLAAPKLGEDLPPEQLTPIEIQSPDQTAEIPEPPETIESPLPGPGAQDTPAAVDPAGTKSPSTQSVWWWIWLALGVSVVPFAAMLTWRKLIERDAEAIADPASHRVARTRLIFRDLFLPSLTSGVFSNGTTTRIAADFRRHREEESRNLDVDRTLRKTIAAGGLPRPVLGTRRLSPEYLILIDRRSYRDHLAWFFQEMIDQLIEDGVYAEVFEFEHDPRAIWKPQERQGRGTPRSVQSLVGPYAGYRLLVFANPDSLIDPLTGKFAAWAEVFEEWPERALFTEHSPMDWGAGEDHLIHHGFKVLPSDLSGLEAFIVSVNRTRPSFEWVGQQSPRLPDLLADGPHGQDEDDWDEEPAAEPDEQTRQAIVATLRSFLGEDGFFWICASAVAPALDWNFTLYLGQNLTDHAGAQLMTGTRLRALAALPWFRSGEFPDWLRDHLVDHLSREQKETVRGLIAFLLLSASPDAPLHGYRIDAAVAKDEMAARALESMVARARPDSAMRDRTLSGLISPPKESGQVTRRQGNQVLIAMGIALSASVYLWFGVDHPGKLAWWLWGFGMVYVLTTASSLWQNLREAGWPAAKVSGLYGTVLGSVALAVALLALFNSFANKSDPLNYRPPPELADYPSHVQRELAIDSELRKGDSSPQVRRVQEWLALNGIKTPIDGHYGPATAAGVEAFQKKLGLKPTGLVEIDTWEALTKPLRNALAPIDPKGRSLNEVMVLVAEQHLAQRPAEVGGKNQGPWVRVYCLGNDGPKWFWNAGFANFILSQGSLVLGTEPPIAGSINVDTLGTQASEQGLLVRSDDVLGQKVQIQPGDIFLAGNRGPLDWDHCGIVSRRESYLSFIAIEGTSGRPEGKVISQPFNMDGGDFDFIHWAGNPANNKTAN